LSKTGPFGMNERERAKVGSVLVAAIVVLGKGIDCDLKSAEDEFRR